MTDDVDSGGRPENESNGDADDPAADFEFTTEIRVRFRDIDAMGHVNNAVYATYLEQARAEYFRSVLGESLAAVDSVLATMTIDFERAVEPDGTVTVALSVGDIGRSSVPMTYEIRREDGSVAARAETVQVAYDRDEGRSRPVPDAWRERFQGAEPE